MPLLQIKKPLNPSIIRSKFFKKYKIYPKLPSFSTYHGFFILNPQELMFDDERTIKITYDWHNEDIIQTNKNQKTHCFFKEKNIFRFGKIILELAILAKVSKDEIPKKIEQMKKNYKNKNFSRILMILEKCLLSEKDRFSHAFQGILESRKNSITH